jgi:hypothetical protein
VRRYISLVDGPAETHSYEDLRAIDQIVKGDEIFAFERLEAGGQVEAPLRGLSEDRLIEVVARMTGMTKEDLTGAQKGGSVAFARCLAAYVGRRLCGISTRRLARRFQRDDSSFVRPMANLEKRLHTDGHLRDQLGQIVHELRSGSPRPCLSDETPRGN